jgi:hypothetical protein
VLNGPQHERSQFIPVWAKRIVEEHGDQSLLLTFPRAALGANFSQFQE